MADGKTTTEVAKIIGVSRSRIRHLIADGKLRATKVGRDWVIANDDIESLREAKGGRPRGGGRMD